MFAPTHVEKVIRHLVRFGATHVDAEDLAQESLLIAWKKQGELDRDRSLDGWLFGIARNVYRNHARSERRSPFTEAPGSESRPAPGLSITSALAVRAAVQTLPENQQDIVILHELEQYTLKETAELLAIPFDTAKDRLKRAREALRSTMSDDLATSAEAERHDARTASKAAVAGVLAGFLGLLARSGTAAAATGGAIAAGQAVVSSAWTAKLAIAAALVAGGIGMGVVAQRTLGSPRDARPAAVATSQPPAPAPVVVAATPAAPVVPAVVAAPVVAPVVAPVRVPGRPDPLGPGANSEAQVIERARTALTRGAHAEALRTLMSHERTFPDGQLAEERDVLAIEAYVATANVRIARDRIARFQAAYPASIHRAKVAGLADELERAAATSASP